MYSINFGSGPSTVSVADLMRQIIHQIKSQELQKVGDFVHMEDNKLMQGQPVSLYDFYA